jgi:serine/threonine protein kinase
MRKFNHINLLKLLDIIRIPDKIFIILEFCDGGDLRNYIKVQKKIS